MPAISVLLPTYNPNLPWLEAALRSVRAQNCPDYEVVLVNDGSNKVAATDIAELGARIDGEHVRFYSQAKNAGFNRAVNFALEQAAARYALVLGDDDFLTDPTFFTDAIAQMDRNPGVNLLLADYILRREELDCETPIRMFTGEQAWVKDGLEIFWERFWLPATPAIGWGSLVFSVAAARKAGGFREPVGDMRLFIALLQQGRMAYRPEISSCYRYRQSNTSSRGNFEVLCASLLNVERLAVEAFDQAHRLSPLDQTSYRQRRAVMTDRCRVHAGRNLRYFRSLGRISFRQALAVYPLVFTARTLTGLVQSLSCLACLFLPPAVLRWLKAVVVSRRSVAA